MAQDFYNYLDGKWLDNTLMTYGGDGRNQNNPVCNFMFPGDTDPAFPDKHGLSKPLVMCLMTVVSFNLQESLL